jgi:hypothetical protein
VESIQIGAANCALCSNPIGAANNSEEHVVPNSIGGREKVRGFLCKDCNSECGKTWDAEIWRQFANLALMHGVRRDRGEMPSIPVQTVAGERLLLHSDGTMVPRHPKFSKEPLESGFSINVAARTKTEAIDIAKSLKRKHPEIDIEQVISNMKAEIRNLDSPVTFSTQFAGPLAGRSMVKSAAALAFWAGIAPQACERAVEYFRSENATPPYSLFYLRDLVGNRPTEFALNCVSVRGESKKKRLLGYVEYFGVARLVTILSNNYEGIDFSATYAFNPADGQEFDPKVDLALSDEEMRLIEAGEANPDEGFVSAANSAMSIIHHRNSSRELNRLTEDAFRYAAEKMGISEGNMIPPERMPEFSAYLAKVLAPFFVKLMAQHPSNAGG